MPVVVDFPDDRILRRPAGAGPDEIILQQADERLIFDSDQAFFAALRNADPELKRRLAQATAVVERAEALSKQATAALEIAQRREAEAAAAIRQAGLRAQAWTTARQLLSVAMVAGMLAAALVFAVQP